MKANIKSVISLSHTEYGNEFTEESDFYFSRVRDSIKAFPVWRLGTR
ncbi:hypothetical protein H5968_00655 [Sphaerospermopsis sp. LEGE 00249]|nr:hypothetical protein [Sphaerospermopsis sp. LEGE 00249]MBC5793706.1 hypothetical protein [Sphaerospermopsis sp. LEGE 00249]